MIAVALRCDRQVLGAKDVLFSAIYPVWRGRCPVTDVCAVCVYLDRFLEGRHMIFFLCPCLCLCRSVPFGRVLGFGGSFGLAVRFSSEHRLDCTYFTETVSMLMLIRYFVLALHHDDDLQSKSNFSRLSFFRQKLVFLA